ncbi:MAG: hypothetical protein ACK4R2_01315 [Roseateles sp.]
MRTAAGRALAPLRARWAQQAQRIDALSLRERVFLFLSIAAVMALVFDSLVLEPLAARAQQRSEARARAIDETNRLREQFRAASRTETDTPAAHLQAQLEAARAERQRLDDALRRASSPSSAEGLSALLQRVLANQPGLLLERLTLLADEPASPAAPGAPAPTALAGLSWQGVELQVQGSYADTHRYLQALERELPALRWGEMQVARSGPDDKPRLLARIHLLKVQP